LLIVPTELNNNVQTLNIIRKQTQGVKKYFQFFNFGLGELG